MPFEKNDGKWLKTGYFSSLLPNALPSRPDIDSTRENVLVIREDVSSKQLIPLVNAELGRRVRRRRRYVTM